MPGEFPTTVRIENGVVVVRGAGGVVEIPKDLSKVEGGVAKMPAVRLRDSKGTFIGKDDQRVAGAEFDRENGIA